MPLNRFQKWALATLAATVFLIFVGGFVRASGAGLGCPDWPRCWGVWLPPTDVSLIDASQYDVSQFNAVKMWIEYINRIIGVLVGLFIIGTVVLSFSYWKESKAVVLGSIAALVLVVFQGWLGGQVVRSQLEGGLITVHMVVAVVLLSLLVWVTFRASVRDGGFVVGEAYRKTFRICALVFFAVCALQVVTGSQVREEVDLIDKSGAEIPRGEWLESIGFLFKTHRTTAWAFVILSAAVAWYTVRSGIGRGGRMTVWAMLGVVAIQMISGVVLSWFALPPAFQVVHLGMSSVLVCLSFLLVVGLAPRRILLAEQAVDKNGVGVPAAG